MPSGESDLVPNAILRFITGKGGVGKTTVAAAHAALAAKRGDRVLAVDTLNRGDLAVRSAEAASLGAGLAGDNPVVLGLTTTQSLDEYVKRYLKIPVAPSALGPLSRILEFVSTAAPGVKEILTVGKIGHETVNGPWDQVVVDAPASGHVTELLAAPQSLRRLAPGGPLSSQTDWLRDLMASGSTALTVVATPEELPVAETSQLLDRLVNETEVKLDTLVINRVPPTVATVGLKTIRKLKSENAMLRALVAVAVDRDKSAQPYVAELQSLADRYQLEMVEIADDPMDPMATAMASLDLHQEVDRLRSPTKITRGDQRR